MPSLPLQPKKCLIFWDFLIKNVVKIFGIPMSFLGGVHIISGIEIYLLSSVDSRICRNNPSPISNLGFF